VHRQVKLLQRNDDTVTRLHKPEIAINLRGLVAYCGDTGMAQSCVEWSSIVVSVSIVFVARVGIGVGISGSAATGRYGILLLREVCYLLLMLQANWKRRTTFCK
jgi:hypothetical protein